MSCFSALGERTFNELSAICLSRGDLNGDLVALQDSESAATCLVSTRHACEAVCDITYSRLVEKLDRDADCGGHGCNVAGAVL